VHPAIFDQYAEGRLPEGFKPKPGDGEKALLKFLDALAAASEGPAKAA